VFASVSHFHPSLTGLHSKGSLLLLKVMNTVFKSLNNWNGKARLKNVSNYMNTNIYSYLETSGPNVIKLNTVIVFILS
jgi:hypothetical protein